MEDISELESAIASPSTPEPLKEQMRQELSRLQAIKKAEEERIAAEKKSAEEAEQKRIEKEIQTAREQKRLLQEKRELRKQTQA